MPHSGEISVGGHGDAAVVQEVAVAAKICTSGPVYKVHVPAQRLTFTERTDILIDERLLVGVETIRVVPVNSRPLVGIHRVNAVIKHDGVAAEIDPVKHEP